MELWKGQFKLTFAYRKVGAYTFMVHNEQPLSCRHRHPPVANHRRVIATAHISVNFISVVKVTADVA